MHVVYIITAVKWVLNKIIKSKKIKDSILIIFLVFFAVFTGGSASCIRACIMMGIIIISENLYRKNDFFSTWCFSLAIIILMNFYNIENIGMWLSFMCVLGMQKLNIKDSFAVQFAIFPIILYSFNTISFTFFISNFFASFIVGPILILGYISMVLGNYFKIIVIIEEGLIFILFKIAEIVGNFKLSKIYVVSPHILFFVIYYIVLFFVMFVPDKKKFLVKIFLNKKILIITKKIILVAICFIIIFNFSNLFFPEYEVKIVFLDVSQGDSTLVITKSNKKILVDGGENGDYDYGENVVLPYLLKHGISSLDYVMVSHFDSDHCRRTIFYFRKYKSEKYYNWISI